MLEDSPLKAGDIMTRKVVTIAPDASIQQVAGMLAKHGISGMPVVDAAGKLVGMVTEGDLLRWSDEFPENQAWWLNMMAEGFELAPDFLTMIRSERAKVVKSMTREIVTIDEATPISEIARLMSDKQVKRLPVLTDGKLIGIVSRADLVRAFAGT